MTEQRVCLLDDVSVCERGERGLTPTFTLVTDINTRFTLHDSNDRPNSVSFE